jgi:hypothetical protein
MDSPETSNLCAGTVTPFVGIYVVSHFDPSHAPSHEVMITTPMVLPKCNACADVRFSLRSAPVQLIEDNEYFSTRQQIRF